MNNINKILVAVLLAMLIDAWACPSEARGNRHGSGHGRHFRHGHYRDGGLFYGTVSGARGRRRGFPAKGRRR